MEEISEVPSTQELEADVEVAVDAAEEKRMSESFDANALREYGVQVFDEEDFPTEPGSERGPVPVLLAYPFGDKQYILLTDLQNVFNSQGLLFGSTARHTV